VEESEALDLKAATTSADYLQRKIFPEFRVALLHGRMWPDEKDRVMAEFRAGRYHILVSTIVIEVGIDVPNATIMAIEHAERFGLAQLHQLRGRIGRGSRPSHFLLFAEPKSEGPLRRLNIICSTTDGFRIAEEDLKLRGPGEFFGTRQHGLPELRVADIVNDYQLLRLARRDAFKLVAEDADLSAPGHALIRARLEETFRDRLDLIKVG
jgi:ATP-dependent DNA helicase RecG